MNISNARGVNFGNLALPLASSKNQKILSKYQKRENAITVRKIQRYKPRSDRTTNKGEIIDNHLIIFNG